MIHRTLRPILIGLLALGAGFALAQRPLNVPNYLLSSTPTLPLNTGVDGELTFDDGQNFKDGSYLDLYTFDASAGDEVVLIVGSPVLDTYMSLFSPSGELIDWNDDLSSTSDSGLNVFLSETGRYLVVVSSFWQGETGPYTITRYSPDQAPMALFEDSFFDFGSGPPFDSLPVARDLAAPTIVPSELSITMVQTDIDGFSHYVETFTFELTAPRLASISMRSNAFDTYLYLFNDFGDMIASNDDDPEDPNFSTNSNITISLEPGVYTIAATSFFELETGNYDLEVQLFQP
jgi:hypothetical protein